MVKVIGVGGGGCKSVNNLIEEGIDANLVECIAANTCDEDIDESLAPVRILMGDSRYGCRAHRSVHRKTEGNSHYCMRRNEFINV